MLIKLSIKCTRKSSFPIGKQNKQTEKIFLPNISHISKRCIHFLGILMFMAKMINQEINQSTEKVVFKKSVNHLLASFHFILNLEPQCFSLFVCMQEHPQTYLYLCSLCHFVFLQVQFGCISLISSTFRGVYLFVDYTVCRSFALQSNAKL